MEMLDEFDIEAVGAVYVAEEDDREVSFYVVFDLDQLLLIGSGVGRICDGEVAGDLLLDGDASGGVRFRGGAGEERVHAEVADAEKVFDAAAQAAGDGFGEECSGAVVLSAAGGGAQRAFLPGAADGEKRDDIGIGKRRIGTIAEGKFAGAAGKIDGDLILADGGGGFDIEFGIELEGVREIDVAARESESVAAEIHFAAEQVNMAEQDGTIPGAAQMQVAINFHLGAGPFDASAGTGVRGDVEREIAHEGGGSAAGDLRTGAEKRRDVHTRREEEAF